MKKETNKDEERLRDALNGENSFSIPNDYFEELPGKIVNQINALPELNKNSAVNPFEVPKGYFENLSSVISERIVNRKSGFETWISKLQRPRIAIPIAFATILLLAGIFFIKQKNISAPNEQELTVDDLRNSTYLQAMDEELFVDFLSVQKEINTDESLEQYLIDNNIELNQIEKKL